jgi:predicted AAA+ superfamily ATPase
MNLLQSFPKELLIESIEARVAYFEKLPIKHIFFTQTFNQALAVAKCQAGPKVALLAGPTGVGKTTLAHKVYERIMRDSSGQMEKEKDIIPIVYCNAIAPNGSSFGWKDFYIRLLEKMAEPLIEKKILVQHQYSLFPEARSASVHERSVPDSLRRSVEECMRRRRTKILIIDEAHHLLMVANSKRLEFQFEAIKSLALETGATIILVGTYRLLDIRDQSGQLVRRSEIIHFPRYDMREDKETSAFMSALKDFSSHLPLNSNPNLIKDAKTFYLKTGGGVGILKDWLTRALEAFLKADAEEFNLQFLLRYAPSNKALKTIIEEALVGEEKLSDIPLDDLEQLLTNGLPTINSFKPARWRKTAAKRQLPGLRKAVGKRNPVRDPIGGAYGPAN